jgi:predicted ribosome quality control (RQC) complex YloA/Tae2 family protein
MFDAQLAVANLGAVTGELTEHDMQVLTLHYPHLAHVFAHVGDLQYRLEEAEGEAAEELKETTDEAERKLELIQDHANELKGHIDQAQTDIDDDYEPVEPDLEKMGELVALIITETEEFKP